MTPKNKAKELVDKYLCIDEIYNVDLFCDECGMSNDAAKYCALIAVDEILESHYKLLSGVNTTVYKYWQEVKQEIEKL
jgi:hypothetical protein